MTSFTSLAPASCLPDQPAGAPAAPADASPLPGGRRHRADIDGLRALAVAAVILTHAGVPGFSGGFVGVDVFFVISGFLIHRDLLRRAGEGRLSLFDFYGRRMRRTLPALFAVGAATLAASTLVLLPGELCETARSLVGAVLLVPNMVFLTQTGYFDAVAATKPLLHCWSLGVEEQFYLLAPLLALALVRLRRRGRGLALLLLLAAALVACEALRALSASAAFYLMPARAFEFLIGAGVAQGLVPPLRAPRGAEAVAALGLAGLAAALVVFADRGVPHPGWPTLLPCLSTAAILHVGGARRTLVGRALGLPPLAWLGLISYSLYLWHWPILVLARVAELPQTAPMLAGEAALLLLLSALTWRFVEQPFRDPGSPWRRRAPALIPLGGAALLAGAALVLVLRGLPGRFPPEVATVADYGGYADTRPFREGTCFITSRTDAAGFDRAACLHLADDKPNVLLIGDSHAAHLWTGLRDAWPDANILQATASGCKPVLGTVGAGRCTRLMDEMLRGFVVRHRPDVLVLAALWEDADVAPLRRTVAAMQSAVGRIVVVGPMPRYDQPATALLARSLLHADPAMMSRHLLPATPGLDRRVEAAVAPPAAYVSPYRLLCPENRCRLFAAPGVPMQFDYHHLTAPGSAVLMAEVRRENPALLLPQRSTSSR